MEAVGRECDLAILNANHGTVASILRAGKPSLQIPIYVEQSMLAMALVRLGVALAAPPDRAAEIELQFRNLLSNSTCAVAAQKFAERYATFDPQLQVEKIVARLEELAQ
jgi:UDP:flavonoid glycosyltransferase YjiC (YdhE family)